MPNLCQGRLVWVELVGLDGQLKRRPVVIITSDTDIQSQSELVGIACSHSAVKRTPRPADYVEIPYHPGGRCKSKLKKPTVALGRWAVTLQKADLAALPERHVGGIVPSKCVELIVDAAGKWREEQEHRD